MTLPMEQNGLNCRGGSNSAGDADSPSNENGSMSAATTVSPTVNGGPESGNAQLGGMDGIDRRATADLFKRFFFSRHCSLPASCSLISDYGVGGLRGGGADGGKGNL